MLAFKSFAAGFIVFVLAASAENALAQKRNITEKDFWRFVWIGDPQVSPDGTRVAFVRVSVNDKKEGYNTSIWSVSTTGGEEPHQLTRGDHDSTPRWSPDGKYLLFLRATLLQPQPLLQHLHQLPHPHQLQLRFQRLLRLTAEALLLEIITQSSATT